MNTDNLFTDLHTHTTASDGQYTPTQLVHLAAQQGIKFLAITDHDTMSGLDEGVAAGEEIGMTVIRGIELSAKEYPTFHILGYNFFNGPETEDLKRICNEMLQSRENRKYLIIDFLKEKELSSRSPRLSRLLAALWVSHTLPEFWSSTAMPTAYRMLSTSI